MVYLHSVLFWLHIVAGSLALVLFWVPIVTKKGHLNHVKFGHHYKNVMYIVAFAGFLMACMVVIAPLSTKPQYAELENAAEIASGLRVFWSFLGLLAVLSFVSTRHGIEVLKHKNNRKGLRTFSYVSPIALLLIGGAVFVTLGIKNEQTLHLIFGLLSVAVSAGMLKYLFSNNVPSRSYILEHIGSIIGSGIGAYTAFLSFGARRILEVGQWEIVFWIAPALIGVTASVFVCKRYKLKYKVVS